MKLKTTSINMINLDDWDRLVVKTYGKIYNFQQQDDCKGRGLVYLTVPCDDFDFENDTVPEVINGTEMGVSFKAWLARDPKEWNGDPNKKNCLNLFWERNFYPSLESVANDLHEKGLLPAGNYAINIDW